MCTDEKNSAKIDMGITTFALRSQGAALRARQAGQSGLAVHQEAFVHVLRSGDALQSWASAEGSRGSVVVEGDIGPFHYELEMALRIEGDVVVVSLDVRKPIDLPPFEWRFDLKGIVRDATGEISGAAGLRPSGGTVKASLDWWCVVRCGGTSIFGVLVGCLPSLAGGPKAYVACVIANLGGSAAKVAECIANECTR